MSRIPCPLCGSRDVTEFLSIDSQTTSAGTHVAERWFHQMGCGRTIDLQRNVLTGEAQPIAVPLTAVLPPVPPPPPDLPVQLEPEPVVEAVDTAEIEDFSLDDDAARFSFGSAPNPPCVVPAPDDAEDRWAAVSRDDGRVISRRVARPVKGGGGPRTVSFVRRRAVAPAPRFSEARRATFESRLGAEATVPSLFATEQRVPRGHDYTDLDFVDTEGV